MGDYESLKVVELKEELRKRELTVSGKKVELIARLQAHDEEKVPTPCLSLLLNLLWTT